MLEKVKNSFNFAQNLINVEELNKNGVKVSVLGSDFSVIFNCLGDSYRATILKCSHTEDTIDSKDINELAAMAFLRINNLISGEKALISEVTKKLVKT